MDESIRLRVRESPSGGSRIAWSYLSMLLAAVAASVVLAAAAPLVEAACSGQEALCNVGWLVVAGASALVACLAGTAWAMRLGWEWWIVVAALVLGSPLWAVGSLGWGLVLPALLAPGIAGLITWTGSRRPPWRPWAVVAAATFLLGGAGWVVLGG